MAAHNLIAITDESVKKGCGRDPEQILELLHELVKSSGIKMREEQWHSYDNMNNKIRQTLNI